MRADVRERVSPDQDGARLSAAIRSATAGHRCCSATRSTQLEHRPVERRRHRGRHQRPLAVGRRPLPRAAPARGRTAGARRERPPGSRRRRAAAGAAALRPGGGSPPAALSRCRAENSPSPTRNRIVDRSASSEVRRNQPPSSGSGARSRSAASRRAVLIGLLRTISRSGLGPAGPSSRRAASSSRNTRQHDRPAQLGLAAAAGGRKPCRQELNSTASAKPSAQAWQTTRSTPVQSDVGAVGVQLAPEHRVGLTSAGCRQRMADGRRVPQHVVGEIVLHADVAEAVAASRRRTRSSRRPA